jgi:hypothetical protein
MVGGVQNDPKRLGLLKNKLEFAQSVEGQDATKARKAANV